MSPLDQLRRGRVCLFARDFRSWRLVGTGLLAVTCLFPSPAPAQEWHELYADGVAALRRGEARRAAGLLRRAIEKRPQPGQAVPTYGTNFEPRYFPYLRLAEACLLQGAHEEARVALETSARFGIEPAEERAALVARVRAALEAKGPPPDPTPPVFTAPLPSPEGAAPSLVPVPAAPAPDALVSAPSAPRASPTAPVGPAVETVSPRPSSSSTPRATRPSLEITSDPPGAQVFLDDVPVGRTDPQTGRLRLTGLAAGRHRVRLSSEGRDDVVRDLDVGSEPLTLSGALPVRPASPLASPAPVAAPAPGPPLALVAGLGLIVVVVLVLWVRSLARLPRPVPPVSGTGPVTDESLPVSFGDYVLRRRIGKGGMAAVYEATKRGERLALKRPLAALLDDPRFRERFLREAELGRTLHHPNIVRIVDRGEIGEVPYFAMELVDGETLRDRLEREGPLDVREAARVTRQVAEALDYAHHKGVVHRDLKPSNIMLERTGAVKVMDYGIARALRLEGLTTTGFFLGTPEYAAPEAVEGTVQPRSDLYSLGVVFFEMLTGSLPFRGDTAFALLRSHCTTPPPAPSSLRYGLPVAVDRIVLRLLGKEPSGRPSAEELINELSDYLAEGR